MEPKGRPKHRLETRQREAARPGSPSHVEVGAAAQAGAAVVAGGLVARLAAWACPNINRDDVECKYLITKLLDHLADQKLSFEVNSMVEFANMFYLNEVFLKG